MATTIESSGSFSRALAGQYEILREIGRGGMGVVFLAREVMLDRDVAVKTLPPQFGQDPAVRERFLREARTAASLSHPNIVPIFRAEDIDGHVYFAMGFVDGESLAQRVRARGPLPMREALRIMRDVSLALGYAHAHGVIHRDVKSENVLLEHETERALVTDFGIARFAEAAPLTATGQVLGSVHYMSPEQVSGGLLDGRSDLYSLGVTAYYAMTGAFPFDSDTASAILVAHVNNPPPRFRDVAPLAPVPVAAIIDRCLTKSPSSRFHSAAELTQAIDDALARLGSDGDLVAVRDLPPVISEVEAQRLWERAAELQAMTGARQEVRAPRLRPRSRQEAASMTSGYRLGDVRDAALEAGIASEFVERALEEHGLAFAAKAAPPNRSPARRTPPDQPRRVLVVPPRARPKRENAALFIQERQRPSDSLIRSPTRIVFDAAVDGELPERDWDILLEIIRRRAGEVGQATTVGRALGWSCTSRERVLQVSIVARNGQTSIHVEEDLHALSRTIMTRVVGGGGWLLGAVLFVVTFVALENPVLALMLWPATVLSSFAAARTWFDSVAAERRVQLREMLESLIEQIPLPPGSKPPEPEDPARVGR